MNANDNGLWAKQVLAAHTELLRVYYGNLRIPEDRRQAFIRLLSKNVHRELKEVGCEA